MATLARILYERQIKIAATVFYFGMLTLNRAQFYFWIRFVSFSQHVNNVSCRGYRRYFQTTLVFRQRLRHIAHRLTVYNTNIIHKNTEERIGKTIELPKWQSEDLKPNRVLVKEQVCTRRKPLFDNNLHQKS